MFLAQRVNVWSMFGAMLNEKLTMLLIQQLANLLFFAIIY